jgi:hypothetical protein
MPATDQPQLLPVGVGLIEGWPADTFCPECGRDAVYYLDYDATCCLACNRWIAFHCPDPGCDHCRLRPARPGAGSEQEHQHQHQAYAHQ